jgi:hypothetical protein
MKKLLPTACIAGIALSGCAALLPLASHPVSGQPPQQILTATEVQLSSGNFRIIKTNAVGSSWGVNFLGIFPLLSPDIVKALSNLYENGCVGEGRPVAIVNVVQQNTAPYFILFSIPRITVRADVVEFVDGGAPPQLKTQEGTDDAGRLDSKVPGVGARE